MRGTFRLPWLDVVRLLAMALVAFQHVQSVCGASSPKVFFHLDLGQFGVALFFSISGYLGVQGRRDGTAVWLTKRMSRVFVPYWITVTAVLLANRLIRYKPASLGLVVSEYLGIAGWTHRDELIAVHFWFISLLLLCYLACACIRQRPWSLPVFVLAASLWLRSDAHYAGQSLAFLTGAACGLLEKRTQALFLPLVGVGGVLLAQTVHIGFAFLSVAVLPLAALWLPWPRGDRFARLLSRASESTYHFYLVHAPAYLAFARWGSSSFVMVLTLGTLVALCGTIVLRGMESTIRQLALRLSTASRPLPAP